MVNNSVSPRIGAFVLETLTVGMYTNPLDTLREYVQNSFDSIREAERQGILAPGGGRVVISIDETLRSITIRDNGMGVPSHIARSALIDVGMSSKDLRRDAGFRGIGRLAGIAYCERLILRTQFGGEREGSLVTFDCDGLRKRMTPEVVETSDLGDVISSHVSFSAEPMPKVDHYFEVSMQGINEAGAVFLAWKNVHDYLCQVAPVGFDTQSCQYASTIHDWLLAHDVQIPTVSLIINHGPLSYQVFKPYRKSTYTTMQEKYTIEVRSIRLFPDNAGPHSPFWGWYAETNCPGTFGDPTVAGFRLRKANIGIGMAERMTEVFAAASESYARLNKYFMGEIYIQDAGVIPNARRDGFEDSAAWARIRSDLVEFARERSREAHQKSQARNIDIERLSIHAHRKLELAEKRVNTGFASITEKNAVLHDMDKQIAKLDAANQSDRSTAEKSLIDELNQKLRATRDKVDQAAPYMTRIVSTLDRRQRKLITEIVELLYGVLDSSSFEKARDAIFERYGASSKELGK